MKTHSYRIYPASAPAMAPAREAGAPAPLRWAPAAPAAITLAVALWGISGPSLWRDEAATVSAARRPIGDLLRMLTHVDAVHGAYYLLMWVVVRAGGTSELALRLPSALSVAAAAGMVASLGRRLVSARAGVAAGLVFAVLPPVSWFGQDARPFALEAALACAASCLLVRMAAGQGRPGRRIEWPYSLALIALGLVNLFGLLLVPAHAVTVACRRRDLPGAGLGWRWLVSAACACLALAPLAVLGWLQRDQIGWLRPPGLAQLAGLSRLAGGQPVALAMLALGGSGVAMNALCGRARPAHPRPAHPQPVHPRSIRPRSVHPRSVHPRSVRPRSAGVLALCVPWLTLPVPLLFAASVVHPVYVFRYVFFCVPAAALLAGTALAAAGRVATAGALALVVLLGLPAQQGERRPDGHGDPIRQADHLIAALARPGDGVIYLGPPGGTRTFAAAYPYGLARLRDISVGQSPARSGTIGGTDAPLPTVRARLSGLTRVWVVQTAGPRPPAPVAALSGTRFRRISFWQAGDIWLRLFRRLPVTASTPVPRGASAARGPAPSPGARLPGYATVPR